MCKQQLKHFEVIMILFFLTIIIAGCGNGYSGKAKTTSSPQIPMVRITIQLIDVYCDHKQDAFWVHDNFYMLTTFAASKANPKSQPDTQALLTEPLDITSGQDEDLPQSHLLAFDGLVPLGGSIKGGFTAYNDQQGLTWSNINQWTADIAKLVSDQLLEDSIDSLQVEYIAPAFVLDLGVNYWDTEANMTHDNSNQLGYQSLGISASGPPSQEGTLRFVNPGGWLGIGSWDYTVRYLVTRTLVAS